jgi:hypothetical protein
MNQIEIFRPFSEAYELTATALFRPFDLKKWLVMGFAAWLGHVGAGFNFNYRYGGNSDFKNSPFINNMVATVHQIPLWLFVSGITALLCVIVFVVVLLAWIRARGRFIFIDCIVKNRAAITEPWHEYAREGNSYFLFSLLVGFSFAVLAVLLSLFFFVPLVRGAAVLHLHDIYLITTFALSLGVVVLLLIAWVVISHFMIMLMYRQRCPASEAFRPALSLIGRHPGEITLYCLFWVVLGLATVCVACLATCFTCCLAALPYVGTVILLPVYMCLRAFALCFLRQFGSECDVWANGATPPAPSGAS